MNADASPRDDLAPNWRHVGAFLALTFGLTIYLRGGLRTPGIAIFTQLQTLLPAFSAILLGLLFFRDSPIYRARPAGRGRWFYYFFLLMSAVYAIAAMRVLVAATQNSISVAVIIIQVLALLGLLLLIMLRFVARRESLARVWLSWGNARYWLLFGLGFIIFYALQAALNAFFGLGGRSLAVPGTPAPGQLATAGVQAATLAPLLGIVVFFGEEYGWRGYLQSELFKLGRIRGALLVGVIWGAWHWPIILMGVNYPGHPLLGLVLMTLYSTGNAIVLGYAVLKSGSVLLAAYLHGVIDQVVNFIVALGFRPNDPAFAFGIGIYGIAMLAIIALFILRDPIWRERGSNLP